MGGDGLPLRVDLAAPISSGRLRTGAEDIPEAAEMGYPEGMDELLRTNDVVALGLMVSLLEQTGIIHFVADAHVSAIEGSIGAFPRRLLVASDSLGEARTLMQDAGLAEFLPDLQD